MTKKVLISGYSGFLGKHVMKELLRNGYDICTIGRSVVHNIECHTHWNLNETPASISDQYFEKVIHIAAKAHVVPKTVKEEEEFYIQNSIATKNLLDGLNTLSTKPKLFVFISTVAVYGLEKGIEISEEHPQNPTTPYGISKLQAENHIVKWCESSGTNYLILRLPLVVGSNPPGNLGKMIRSITKRSYVKILGNDSRKSAVLAKDVSILIASDLNKSGVFNLTDGVNPKFAEIEEAIQARMQKRVIIKVPLFIIRTIACAGDIIKKYVYPSFPISSSLVEKLTSTLTFSDDKAKKLLGWTPSSTIQFMKEKI